MIKLYALQVYLVRCRTAIALYSYTALQPKLGPLMGLGKPSHHEYWHPTTVNFVATTWQAKLNLLVGLDKPSRATRLLRLELV
jgi:hypothetical protein